MTDSVVTPPIDKPAARRKRLQEEAAARGKRKGKPNASQATGTQGPQGGSAVPFPIMIDPKDPMATAKTFVRQNYYLDGRRTLRHHFDEWRAWVGSHWAISDNQAIRCQIWDFMAAAETPGRGGALTPVKPTRDKVSDVMDALRAVCNLPLSATPPCWLAPTQSPRPEAADLIACANGLLHLPTRTLHPHTPTLFNVNANPFDFDPAATCPNWLAFLAKLWPDDQQTIDALQEWFGYFLANDTRQHKILLLIGPMRGGKGTIGRVLTALLGTTNVCSPTLSSFSMNFGTWQLIDKKLAIIADARLSGRQDQHIIAERLLSISGEDIQTIDRKFKEAWTGRLPTRFMILTNELPASPTPAPRSPPASSS